MNFRDPRLHHNFNSSSLSAEPILRAPATRALTTLVDFSFVAGALRRHARIITLVTLAGLGATYGLLKLVAPRYAATASLMLDIRPKGLLGTEASAAGPDDLILIESQIELLRSGRIAARVLRSLAPKDRAAFVKTVSETAASTIPAVSAMPAGHDSTATEPAAGADLPAESIEALLQKLKVERKGRSYLVDVRFSDTDPERAALIANTFVDAFVADQLEGKQGAIRAANNWLEQRIGEIGAELEAKERQQQSYRSDKDMLKVGDMSLIEREIADTALQLANARGNVASAVARLQQIRGLTKDPDRLLSLDSSLQSPVINEYRRQIGEVERKRAQVTSQFGSSHPNALAAEAEIEQLRESVRAELARIVESAELELQSSQNKASLLQADLQALKERSVAEGQSNVVLTGLQRDIDATSNLYVTLLKRFKETQAQEKEQSADAHVVTYAVAAKRPSFPNKTLFMLLAGFCWLGVGAGASVGREILLPTLRTARDVERISGIECVAALPFVDMTEAESMCRPGHSLAGPIYWQLDDREARAFISGIFKIRKWVMAQSDEPQVVLVAGIQVANGASTLALQLAKHASRTGLKTALVDSDLRSTAISEALWEGGEMTYPDVVMRGEVSQISTVPDESRGVKLFPATRGLDSSSLDILGSRGMEQFLERLRSQFDLIVIDAPAFSECSDADALADFADAVLLVGKHGVVDHGEIADAIARLGQGMRMAIALNMVKP